MVMNEETPSPATGELAPQGVRLVGIGASAGGLEALRELLDALPDTDGLCYVIAQHVSPTHVSMLMSLLTPMTPLRVRDLVDRQAPEPGVVYITPPNNDVVLQEGLLHLRQPRAAIGPKPSVNSLFHSLAAELGERAIGIILSGTGSDGAAGVRAIKAAGGVVIVQEPESAKYDGMPRAAIHTGCVDLILPTAQIGQALERLLEFPPDFSAILDPSQEADEYAQISNLVRVNAAFKLNDYKPTTVRRRIARRMGIVGVATVGDYIALLKMNREESRQLMRDTFISVTTFFRDPEAFDALGSAIGELVGRRNDGEVIRCWVPACASGEEVYSIAMLLEEALREQDKAGLQYLIFASDVDDDSIDRARQALYPLTDVDNIPKAMRVRYMEVIGDHCRIAKRVRNRIVFTRQNLIEDPPFSRMDLISCRNLLIYLVPQVQKRVLEVLHYSLNPGGYLLLGRSESIELHSTLFTAANQRMRLYRRSEAGARYALPMTLGIQRSADGRKDEGRSGSITTDLISVRTLEQLAERYAPPSLVVNGQDIVVHFQGDPKPFLSFPKGRADMYLFDLVDAELRAELRALVFQCRRVLHAVLGSAHTTEGNGRALHTMLSVSPLEAGRSELLLVSFVPARTPETPPATAGAADDTRDSIVISELEQELATTRAHLHVVVEELETSNEELQSLNEELQSTNEELQSTNEELQTSNEELQSTNEELLTVNDELQAKSADLEALANDLANVKESLSIPLLVIDAKLRITQANAACRTIIAMDGPLEGSSLTSVNWLVDLPGLSRQVNTVINEAREYRATVHSPDGQAVFELRIMPYRIDRMLIAGAVLLFDDVTQRIRIEQALQRSNERFELAMRGTSDGVWDWNVKSGESYWAPRFKEILGYRDEEIVAELADWDSRRHPDDVAAILGAMQRSLKEDKPYDVEYRARRKSGEYVWIRVRGQVVARDANGQPLRMAGAITDVTLQKQIEDQLRASERKFHLAMRGASIGMALVAPDGRFLDVNPALCQIVGYPEAELLARDFQSLTHPDDLDADLENVRRMLAGEVETCQTEKRYVHKAGHVVWAQFNASLVRGDDGSPHYLISQVQDITERKQAQAVLAERSRELEHANRELQRSNRDLEQFAYVASHDLQEPLRMVTSYTGLLQERYQGRLDKDADEFIGFAVDGARRMRSLIEDLLEYSRFSRAADHKAAPERVEIAAVLDAVRTNLAVAIAESGARIEIATALPQVRASRWQIEQLVQNLLSNAIKFRGAQPPLVHMGATSEGRMWRLTVTDNGIGIAPEFQDKIFDLFKRLHPREQYAGTGIGLAVCRRIVEAHGGEIGVDSVPGQGSSFWCTLPAWPMTDPSDAAAQAEPTSPA